MSRSTRRNRRAPIRPFVEPQRGKARPLYRSDVALTLGEKMALRLAAGVDPVEVERMALYGDPSSPSPKGVLQA